MGEEEGNGGGGEHETREEGVGNEDDLKQRKLREEYERVVKMAREAEEAISKFNNSLNDKYKVYSDDQLASIMGVEKNDITEIREGRLSSTESQLSQHKVMASERDNADGRPLGESDLDSDVSLVSSRAGSTTLPGMNGERLPSNSILVEIDEGVGKRRSLRLSNPKLSEQIVGDLKSVKSKVNKTIKSLKNRRQSLNRKQETEKNQEKLVGAWLAKARKVQKCIRRRPNAEPEERLLWIEGACACWSKVNGTKLRTFEVLHVGVGFPEWVTPTIEASSKWAQRSVNRAAWLALKGVPKDALFIFADERTKVKWVKLLRDKLNKSTSDLPGTSSIGEENDKDDSLDSNEFRSSAIIRRLDEREKELNYLSLLEARLLEAPSDEKRRGKEVEISQEERAFLTKIVEEDYSKFGLFSPIPEQVTDLISAMRMVSIPAKQVIVNRGDPGKEMFIVAKGKVDISGSSDDGGEESGGTRTVTRGALFGAVSLVSYSKVNHLITSKTDVDLWVLEDFMILKYIFENSQILRNVHILRTCDMFSSLSDPEIYNISKKFSVQKFKKHDTIVKTGTTADNFYILLDGSWQLIRKWKNSRRRDSTTKPFDVEFDTVGSTIGAYEVLKGTQYVETCIAGKGGAAVLVLPRIDFVTHFKNNAEAIRGILNEIKVDALRSVRALSYLTAYELSPILDCFKFKTFQKDDKIVQQARLSKYFYIVLEGLVKAEFRQIAKDTNEIPRVNAYFSGHATFAERSLLNRAGEAASIVAVTDTVECLAISIDEFGKIMGEIEDLLHIHNKEQTLRRCRLFASLGRTDIRAVCDYMELISLEPGEILIRKDEKVASIYIVHEGIIKVRDTDKEGGEKEVNQFGPNSCFFERAMASTVVSNCEFYADDSYEGLIQVYAIYRVQLEESIPAPMAKIKERFEELTQRIDTDKIDVRRLRQIGIIGTGSFGVVKVVSDAKGRKFALKVQNKKMLIEHRLTHRLKQEVDILQRLDHPFIIYLFHKWIDRHLVYMLTDLAEGIELFKVMRQYGPFKEEQTSFYCASIVSMLAYLHSKDIVYRDLKPENLMVELDGYLKLVDLGMAKVIPPGNKSFTLCGTLQFMAPEIVLSSGHDKAVDYWALGILTHEMLSNELPMGLSRRDKSKEVSMEQIVSGQLTFSDKFDNVSNECLDMLRKLLTKDPRKRLGSLKGGAQDLISHAFFNDYGKRGWEGLSRRRLDSPFRPAKKLALQKHLDDSILQRGNNSSLASLVCPELDKLFTIYQINERDEDSESFTSL